MQIKEIHPMTAEVYAAIEKNERDSRGYLGMSIIGKPCMREVWMNWRQFTGAAFDGRVLMIFEFGRKIEEQIIKGLRLAGYRLSHAHPDAQLSFRDHGGFFAGHSDGEIFLHGKGDAVLECKSANKDRFKEFQKNGVKETSPEYYAQVQCYMKYSGRSWCLFVIMCKDNCDLHFEEIPFIEADAKEQIGKASRIIQTHNDDGNVFIPDGISQDKDHVDCKWCRYKTPCHEPKEAIQTTKSCRSCSYLKIDGSFAPICQKHQRALKDISRVCPSWAWVWRCPF